MSNTGPGRNTVNSTGDITGGFKEILKAFLRDSVDDMLPARIVSYDRDTNRAQVQPLIALVKSDGTSISRAQIASIPVINLGGGGFIMSFPLKPGDLGWIKANDRDIASYLEHYKEQNPTTNRHHDFSSSVFIPDVTDHDTWTIDAEDEENAILQNLDGTVRIALWEDKIKVTTPTLEVVCETLTDVTSPTVTVVATTAVNVTSPITTVNGDATVTGNVILASGGGTVNLGVGGPAIARVGDPVLVGGIPGVITGGSANHNAT